MKSKFFKVLGLTIVLLAIASMSVFAGKPAELKVFVRNHTGAPVEIRLTDKAGNTSWMSVADGVNQATLTEGKYEYYATTACGTDMGTWNLNVSKQLDINCSGEKAELSLEKRCPDNFVVHYIYVPSEDVSWWFKTWADENYINNTLWYEYGYTPDYLDQGVDCFANKTDHGW